MTDRVHPGFARRIVRGIRRRVHAFLFRFSPSRFANTYRWIVGTFREVRDRRREPRLTVAVDITPFWESLTGIGWYLYRLLEHLADRDDLRLRLYGATLVISEDMPEPVVEIPTGPALERVMFSVPEDMVLPAGPMIRFLRKLQPLLLAADGNRVLFAPNYFLPRRYKLARGNLVATVPDLGVHLVPWALRSETLAELTEHLNRTLFEATRILTISEAVRRELGELGLADLRRVRAVHLAPAMPDTSACQLPPGIPTSFVLHVGTLEPRKNITTLLDAWELVRERGGVLPSLVLCGKFGWKTEELRRRVRRGEEQGWLLHPGYVSDEEVAALYGEAMFVVFPTHYEGFGLPAVEAIRSGTPLLCSDIPVLREVAGEAAIYLPPTRVDLWAKEIERLAGDSEERERLAGLALAEKGRFTWEATAAATAEVWREAAELSSRTGGR